MICPIHGAVPGLKLACEQCTRDRSNDAMQELQGRFIEVVITDRAPLNMIQTFPRGTLDSPSWHIQRFQDRHRAFCGAFLRSLNGLRAVRFSGMANLKPICQDCNEKLHSLISASTASGAS